MTRLRQPLKTADDLVEAHLIAPGTRDDVARVAARYALSITPAIAEIIDAGDPSDPIARQFIPDVRELAVLPAERADPIGDRAHAPLKGIVHRYPDRVLLKIVGTCPVYCRFCFRREMVGPDWGEGLSPEELAGALDYIAGRPEIWEVILTGGDPFVLSPRRIAALEASLAAIGHVKVVRWHTRVPVVAPERVTPDLVAALSTGSKTQVVALHANHPRELGPQALQALARLAGAGIPLVSQTVLLKGVNDDADTLERLMRAFVEARVKPYYLHHADLAPGTAHFRTTLTEGTALMAELRRRLSGLALPTYVIDIPGGAGKVPVGPGHVLLDDAGTAQLIDDHGRRHPYP